jgi:dihydroneopterin aldolase
MDDERDDVDPEDHDDDDDLHDHGGPSEPLVTIEIVGLSLYTHHGVDQAERSVGQRLVFDLSFDLTECDATVTDRVEDTIDYADVCQQVALAAQERSYSTLERLCSAVADRMMDRYGADAVTVRATKPEPPIPLPVEEVTVEVWKERGD